MAEECNLSLGLIKRSEHLAYLLREIGNGGEGRKVVGTAPSGILDRDAFEVARERAGEGHVIIRGPTRMREDVERRRVLSHAATVPPQDLSSADAVDIVEALQVTRLRQRDGTTCGPAVAVMAGAILEPAYGGQLTTGSWFADEQVRVHKQANRIWPRALGTTPPAMARALSVHMPYRWRLFRGRHDDLVDVIITVGAGFPVAMLSASSTQFTLFRSIPTANASNASCGPRLGRNP